MKNIKHCLAACILVLAGTGCKQGDDQSTTQSLDNFAREDGAAITVNQCGINYSGSEKLSSHVESQSSRIQGAKVYRNAVLGALEAVPVNLMGTFFGLGGTVVIAKDASYLCRNGFGSEGQRDFAGSTSISSCWIQGENGAGPKIILPENVDMIRHSTLRLFAYTFTDIFVASIQGAKTGSLATKQAKAAAASFVSERKQLANAFMKDLVSLGRASVYERMLAFKEADETGFGNYVYAEAIDSYYCSDKSRAVFKDQFAATWQRFTDDSSPNAPVKLFGSD